MCTLRNLILSKEKKILLFLEIQATTWPHWASSAFCLMLVIHLVFKEEFSCFLREINVPLILPYFSTNRCMWKSNDKLKIEFSHANLDSHIWKSVSSLRQSSTFLKVDLKIKWDNVFKCYHILSIQKRSIVVVAVGKVVISKYINQNKGK